MCNMRCSKHYLGESGGTEVAQRCAWNLVKYCHTAALFQSEANRLRSLSKPLYDKLFPLNDPTLMPEAIMRYPRLAKQQQGIFPPSFGKIASHAEHGMSVNKAQRYKLFTDSLQDLTQTASQSQAVQQWKVNNWNK